MTIALQPGKESFDFPPALVPAKGTAILSFTTLFPVWRDKLNPVFLLDPAVQLITVVSFIAYKLWRKLLNNLRFDSCFHEGGFSRRSTLHMQGNRVYVAFNDHY